MDRPPAPVAKALEAADVWFEFGGSLLYTEARNRAIEAGCRHACYGGMDVDMMVRTIGKLSLLMPRETDTRAGWIRSSGNNAWDLSNGRFLTGKGVRRATNQKSAQRDRDGR